MLRGQASRQTDSKAEREEGRHGKDKETKCRRMEKEMRMELGIEGRKSIACGKTLKPVHVKTRLQDLRGGSSRAKQRGGEYEREAQTFQPASCTNVFVDCLYSERPTVFSLLLSLLR